VNTAATRSAIKRASQQARNAMQDMDMSMIDDLLTLYTNTAFEVAQAIRAKVNADNMVPIAQLKNLLRQIEDIVDNLGARRDALLLIDLEAAAELGVRPYTLGGVVATGSAGQAVLNSAAAMRVSTDAVAFVQSFTAADGLKLSDRVWRLNQGAKEVLTRAIGQAVVSGWDASRAAAQFMYDGQPVPIDVKARLNGAKVDELVRKADLLVGDQGEVWKADRVFRTEINRAHGTAFMTGAERTPGFVGFRFLLSPRHPRPDICDLLAAQNLYGLGPGVYPDAKRCPWPAHPNTLSFVEMVFDDEVTAADRAGKETPMQAMARLPADVRDGVLGKTKAAYFDQGLLGQGSIRSPLKAVNARLERQAAVASKSMQSHPDALQNFENATLRPEKLLNYSLDMTSESGRDKAIVFNSMLGYNKSNFEDLRQKLLAGIAFVPGVKNLQDAHGQRYTALIPVTGPKGSAVVTTGWIYRPGSSIPDLTTAFIDTRRNKNV
jgi:hypothetical protein